MAWKPKEKPLTPEEALALAKQELAPYWFGSEPLLAGVREGSKVNALPLDPRFNEKAWLMFFIDPTNFSGETALIFAKEWNRRYGMHGLGVLLVCRLPYQYLRTPQSIGALIKKHQLNFPLILDAEELLLAAFGANSLPKVLLFYKGRYIFEHTGRNWLDETEIATQKFLRDRDPGLPLYPVMEIPKNIPKDHSKLELGRGKGVLFPAPGFTLGANGFGAGKFQGTRPEKMDPERIFISGQWLQDGERIATSDPSACIGLRSPTPRLSVIAEALSKDRSIGKLMVEVNGVPAYDAFAGENLVLDDEGTSLARVESGRIYHLLSSLPEENREITFRFPAADRAAVALYGLRFGDQ